MKVGILGCGQLARMLSLAAKPLGIDTICLVAEPTSTENHMTPVFAGSYDNPEDLERFANEIDIITYEFENIPHAVAERLQQISRLHPNANALFQTQDRLHEKTLFQSLDINTPKFKAIESENELREAIAELGLPALVKTRRFGYDGKGQYLIKSEQDIKIAWQTLAPAKLIVEEFINFEYEVSIIAVRNNKQDIRFYPLAQNKHQNGILYLTEVISNKPELQTQAEQIATKILTTLDYVGVLAIELFVTPSGLTANEMAPRVHNSGHWTIDGAITSQFENHIRAICGLPLGVTDAIGHCAMLNCIGTMPPLTDILALDNCHYHDYQKQPRENRKLGHVNLVATNAESYQDKLQQLMKIIQFNTCYQD